MKKLLISFFAALILSGGLYSCKKLIAAVFGGTDVKVPEIQVAIPTVFFITSYEIPIGSFSFSFNLDSIVRANTAGVFGANAVNSIKVKQVSINISNADSLNNLANFESARVTLQSNVNNIPAELFSVTFADSYAAAFTYTPTNSPELLPYLKGSVISYTVYGKMRRTTHKRLNMVVAVILRAN